MSDGPPQPSSRIWTDKQLGLKDGTFPIRLGRNMAWGSDIPAGTDSFSVPLIKQEFLGKPSENRAMIGGTI